MKLKITVDGKVYEVEVEVAEPEPHISHVPVFTHAVSAPGVASPVPPPNTTVVEETKVCRSPFAGVVVRVPAQVGQTIQVNDVLLVLEAMKMETVITSPLAGKVAKVNVKVGDAVQAGQVVVEFAE